MTNIYDKLTDDEFTNILEMIVGRMTTAELMAIPGIHEILREELNNEVLEMWEEQHAIEIAEEQERIDDQTEKCCPHCGASYEGFGCICDDDLVDP